MYVPLRPDLNWLAKKMSKNSNPKKTRPKGNLPVSPLVHIAR